MKEGFF